MRETPCPKLSRLQNLSVYDAKFACHILVKFEGSKGDSGGDSEVENTQQEAYKAGGRHRATKSVRKAWKNIGRDKKNSRSRQGKRKTENKKSSGATYEANHSSSAS